MPNKTANTITVRATSQVADIIERIIRSNDKPRAEVVIDVQILEVNRQRVKQYGLNLNAYALGFMFSPEVAPPNTSAAPTGPPPSPPPFNLNTISQGVSTADFYMTVPTALVRFLETDSRTKTIAKPQLRGAEGTKLTLNLGDDVPVLQTVFGAAAQGGFATIPQSSYTYRSVGVNVEVTPRVTYEGEIIMELVVENSTVSGSIDVGGQSAPTFGTRKVTTRLRMREGESNLLAGLLREDDRRSLSGFPGLLRLPVFKQFLSNNDQQITQTDIVMLLTPHIVRTHELTADDLAPIYIGTQQNLGLGGPPPLIAPAPRRADALDGAVADAGDSDDAGSVARRRSALPGGIRSGCADGQSPARARHFPGADADWPCAGEARAAAAARADRAAGRSASDDAARRRELLRSPPGPRPLRQQAVPETPRDNPTTPPTASGSPSGDAGAGHPDGSGHDVPGRGRTVYGAGLDQQRFARLGDDLDDHLQSQGAARAQRSGRHVHAAGRCRHDLHAADRCGERPRRYRHHPNGRSGRRLGRRPPRRAPVRRRRSGERRGHRQRCGQHSGRHRGAAPVQSGHGDRAVTDDDRCQLHSNSDRRSSRPAESSLGVGRWKLELSPAQGFTFIELLVVTAILLVLASAVMPLARVSVQRQREMELHRYLREMRLAIDKYKDAADAGAIGAFDIKAGSEGYPPDLETLVEGVSVVNDQSGRKLKFLRRVPIDPMTNSTRVGHAFVPGQAGFDVVGRSERLRRLLEVDRYGTRRHEVQGLVNVMAEYLIRRAQWWPLNGDTAGRRCGLRGVRGFTLIELLVVISMISILAAMGVVQYRNSVQRTKEAILKKDLFEIRDVIDQYYADKGKYPSSLDALVSDGYLRKIPVDPITNSADTWETVPAEADPANPSSEPGIYNIKSGAPGTSLEGTAYADF